MSTLSDADVARVLRVVAQGLDNQIDCNGLLNAADRLEKTMSCTVCGVVKHVNDFATPDVCEACNSKTAELEAQPVATPAPARQEPWSKPEHVPGPVCWIRAAEPGAVGYGSLFVAFDKRGIYTRDNDPEDAFVPWAEIHEYEHSLDRVTWLPCTVALPEPEPQEDEEAWIRAKTEELRNQSGTTWTESIEDAIRAGLAHARGGKERGVKTDRIKIGDWFNVEFHGTVEEVPVTVTKKLCVVVIQVEAGSESCWLSYGLTPDPTAPYHYGKTPVVWKRKDELKNPSDEPNYYKNYFTP
jgi:hypothetical protein